jgi:hypothetical protein
MANLRVNNFDSIQGRGTVQATYHEDWGNVGLGWMDGPAAFRGLHWESCPSSGQGASAAMRPISAVKPAWLFQKPPFVHLPSLLAGTTNLGTFRINGPEADILR